MILASKYIIFFLQHNESEWRVPGNTCARREMARPIPRQWPMRVRELPQRWEPDTKSIIINILGEEN